MMTESAKRGVARIGAWSGVIYIALVILGWGIIAGFVPPHPPKLNADEVAEILIRDAFRIQVGMVITMAGAFFCIPFAGALAQYTARIEGKPGVLTYSVVMGGLGNTIVTFYPPIFWLTAVYRAERSPELMLLFNDWAWLQLIGGVSLFWPLPLAMGIAAICDKSKDPVFPRWSGFAAIWLFFAILPDQLLFFFKSGPFAWNGLFGFWIPLVAFAAWFIMVAVFMLKAIKRGIMPDSPSA